MGSEVDAMDMVADRWHTQFLRSARINITPRSPLALLVARRSGTRGFGFGRVAATAFVASCCCPPTGDALTFAAWRRYLVLYYVLVLCLLCTPRLSHLSPMNS